MVMDILRERDQGGFGDRNEYGSRVGGGIDVSANTLGRWAAGSRADLGAHQVTLCLPTSQVPVPRHSVGVVIGRSGEMIKKIQNDAGVRIQFKQGEGWAPLWLRHWCCPPALVGPQCLQRFGTQFLSVAFLEPVSLRLLS